MAIVMDMSSLQIARKEMDAQEYGEEVMYSGWVAVATTEYPTQSSLASGLPANLATVDAELFLRQFDAHQNW